MDLDVVLKGVLPPIGAALLLVSVGGARWTALAAAIGLYMAFGLLKNEWPALPHELWREPDGRQWLVWVIAAAALLTLLEHARVLRGRPALAAGLLAGAAGVWLVLQKVAATWSSSAAMLHIGGGALVLALSVAGARMVSARAPATMFPAVLFTLVLSVDAALLTMCGSAFLGQLCGAVAAALGAATGTVLWRKPFALAAADGTWLAIAHGSFVLAGVHLAEVPWSAAGCAMAAPLVLLLLRPGFGASRPKGWAVAATVCVLVPLAGALWFGVQANSGAW